MEVKRWCIVLGTGPEGEAVYNAMSDPNGEWCDQAEVARKVAALERELAEAKAETLEAKRLDRERELALIRAEWDAWANAHRDWIAEDSDISRTATTPTRRLTMSDSEVSIDRAYAILAGYGVSKERARSVANGIMVLATRYEREIRGLEQALAECRERVRRAEWCWMIENAAHEWWTGIQKVWPNGQEWIFSADPLEGVRFCREQDAAKMAGAVRLYDVAITEHGFAAAREYAPDPPAAPETWTCSICGPVDSDDCFKAVTYPRLYHHYLKDTRGTVCAGIVRGPVVAPPPALPHEEAETARWCKWCGRLIPFLALSDPCPARKPLLHEWSVMGRCIHCGTAQTKDNVKQKCRVRGKEGV